MQSSFAPAPCDRRRAHGRRQFQTRWQRRAFRPSHGRGRTGGQRPTRRRGRGRRLTGDASAAVNSRVTRYWLTTPLMKGRASLAGGSNLRIEPRSTKLKYNYIEPVEPPKNVWRANAFAVSRRLPGELGRDVDPPLLGRGIGLYRAEVQGRWIRIRKREHRMIHGILRLAADLHRI